MSQSESTAKKPTFIAYLNAKVYPWMEKHLGYKRKKPFTTINFDRHWISLFYPTAAPLILESIANSAYYVMFAYWPLVIIWSLENTIMGIVWYALLHGFLIFFRVFSNVFYTIAMQNMITNFEYNISRFFLESDPIHHATKSTGQITSKTSRAKSAIEPLASSLSFSIFPSMVQLLSVGVGFFAVNLTLGLYSTISLIILISILVLSRRFLFSPILKWSYKYTDALNATNLEILQQQNYIRTTMSSDIIMSKVATMSRKLISVLTTRRYSQTGYMNFFRLIWFVMFIGLLVFIIQGGYIDSQPELVTGLLIAYITNAGTVNQLGYTINSLYERSIEIDDLYDYIHTFGSNTYPVISK